MVQQLGKTSLDARAADGLPDSTLARICVMSDKGINLTNLRTVFRRSSGAEGYQRLAAVTGDALELACAGRRRNKLVAEDDYRDNA
jgi:hypothetical protein